MLFDCLDLLELLVPTALQLVGYETIPGIDRVILLKRLSRLIRQLFEFAGQCDALTNIAGTEFLKRFQTRFYSEMRNDLQQFLAQPSIHGGATEADAILSAVVVVALAEVTRVSAPSTPVTYVQLPLSLRGKGEVQVVFTVDGQVTNAVTINVR